MRRRIGCEFEVAVELRSDGGRLPPRVGADRNDCGGRGGCGRSICPETFDQLVCITRYLRGGDARPDFHDVKGSLLCASESVLWIVRVSAALFLRRAWLASLDPRSPPVAIRAWYNFARLDDE